jgi:ABC-type protease/lipase transport system fused ATPase/permease subunit
MDPVTLFLVGIGAVALVGIVLFFLAINNAIAYQKEIADANRKLEELRRKAEDQERRLKQLQQEKERREVEELLKKIRLEQAQWRKETSIASAIVEIAANPTPSNIIRLIRLIFDSFILKDHLKDPKNATYNARRRVDEFVRRTEQSLF